MPISEVQVRTAKSAAKAFKLYDSEGLFLLVTPSGGKLWRLRFKFDGKEKLLTLGAYPKVGLAAARKKRNAAIEDIQAGIDPAAARAEAKAASAQIVSRLVVYEPAHIVIAGKARPVVMPG